MAREVGLLEEVVVRSMTRLSTTGVARGGAPSRPRLLKVVLKNEEMKWNLLKASGKLKESNNQDHARSHIQGKKGSC